jgi:FlaA1/EpsC-like NDP-sugar epimerase
MRGLPVHAMDELDNVIKRFKPIEAMIAKRGQTRSHRRVLLSKFAEQNVAVKIVPDLDEITDGSVNIESIRAVKIEDLLGRDSVPPDEALMTKAVRGQNFLITGAGGSIGSELCRQALAFGAKRLVLVENSEFALFEIHRELEVKYKSQAINLIPVLATMLDGDRMRELMSEHGIDIVFHAAAYKHVRMVQENAMAGIQNNVWGTKSIAEAAMAAGVKRFILISTDKAVRPTSIMGATKRVAEMIIQALAAEPDTKTVFSMVRFGNVLGSTGSVVPLFREQIAAGGLVLVTHPEVIRYFMLIPEAAQFVIQAGAMAKGGEVFVLDMGESIKIQQLARSMIELAGLSVRNEKNPDGDIEIKFIGLGNSEKM